MLNIAGRELRRGEGPSVIEQLATHRRRAVIEDEIEMCLQRVELLIARLDRMEGDCDLEDDDPAGDPLDIYGEPPTDDGSELLKTPPLYAVDQTLGPINEREAVRNWHREQIQ